MSDIKEKLIEQFKRFPGIGSRQAERFVYHLLRRRPSDVDALAYNLRELHKNMKICPESFQYFSDPRNEQTLSPIASNPQRDQTILMVVSSDTDLKAIENSNTYRGKYFVIGGYIDLLKEDLDDRTNAKKLRPLVEKMITSGLKEIILAMSYNKEGDHTKAIIIQNLADLSSKHKIKVSTLGRGLSVGSELEYADNETLQHALENRR